MMKRLFNVGGLILFYLVIIFGVLLLNARFAQLNHINNNETSESYLAMNK